MESRYTLDSLHHQFVANMKTIYTREQVAALVGDTSFLTQASSTGKKRIPWDAEHISERPMPVQRQLAQIKMRFELSLTSAGLISHRRRRPKLRARGG